ncbi:MAG: ATP-binding protein [Ruminiclostridium sp.]|nr:ATP-binding protein [Ruminiclostridium sp.]
MAKVIMTCGRICSGKSTYTEQLRIKNKAVVLSVDEITLALFEHDVGEKHDEYVEKAERYLFDKSVEIIETGIDVILDWGFWTKAERDFAREFYRSKNIENEFHYINISNEEWKKRIEKRNSLISQGKISAYYVDEGLMKKVDGIFEAPSDDEVDLIIQEV